MAGKALDMAKKIKSVINVEFKNVDNTTGFASANIGQNPANWQIFYPQADVTQGDNAWQRNGQKVLFKNFHCNFLVTRNSSGASVQRFKVLVLNRPSNETNLIENDNYFTDKTKYNSPRNLLFVKEYRTLLNREYVLDSARTNSIRVNINIPLNFHTVWAPDPEGLSTDITSGLFGVCIYGDQSTNVPTISQFSSRLYFVDN